MQRASTRSAPPLNRTPSPPPSAPPPPPKRQHASTKEETHLLDVASREPFQFRRDGREVYARVHAILRHGNLQDLLTSLRRSSGKPSKRGNGFARSGRVASCDVMRRDLPIFCCCSLAGCHGLFISSAVHDTVGLHQHSRSYLASRYHGMILL